jgi:hypothetical protein
MRLSRLIAVPLLGAAVLTAAPALSEESGPKEAAETIRWVDGWEAGRAAAAKSGKLLLVYVHRVSPT